jgi:uncharacterized membrane protein
MYHIIQKFHSGWAYLVLLLLVVAIFNSISGWFTKREFLAKDKRMALFGLIATHLQLVIGFILYFVSPKGFESLGQMEDADLRLTSLEHPLLNLLAIILITIGWSKHKNAVASDLKFKSIFVFYLLGLILILTRIPWKVWFNI